MVAPRSTASADGVPDEHRAEARLLERRVPSGLVVVQPSGSAKPYRAPTSSPSTVARTRNEALRSELRTASRSWKSSRSVVKVVVRPTRSLRIPWSEKSCSRTPLSIVGADEVVELDTSVDQLTPRPDNVLPQLLRAGRSSEPTGPHRCGCARASATDRRASGTAQEPSRLVRRTLPVRDSAQASASSRRCSTAGNPRWSAPPGPAPRLCHARTRTRRPGPPGSSGSATCTIGAIASSIPSLLHDATCVGAPSPKLSYQLVAHTGPAKYPAPDRTHNSSQATRRAGSTSSSSTTWSGCRISGAAQCARASSRYSCSMRSTTAPISKSATKRGRRGHRQLRPASPIVDQATERTRERLGVERIDHDRCVPDDLPDRWDTEGHDGCARSERLDDRSAEPFPARGDRDDIGGAEQLRDVPSCAQQLHPALQTSRDDAVTQQVGAVPLPARDDQAHPVARPQLRDGIDQQVLALLCLMSADVHQEHLGAVEQFVTEECHRRGMAARSSERRPRGTTVMRSARMPRCSTECHAPASVRQWKRSMPCRSTAPSIRRRASGGEVGRRLSDRLRTYCMFTRLTRVGSR